VAVGTAGQSTAGRNIMEAVKAAAPGVNYRHAT
jgi:hypothetical protein